MYSASNPVTLGSYSLMPIEAKTAAASWVSVMAACVWGGRDWRSAGAACSKGGLQDGEENERACHADGGGIVPVSI